MYACQNGHAACVDALLMAGAHVDHISQAGPNGLMLTCRNGHVDCLHRMIAAQCKINDVSSDDGRTALMQACKHGHSACVRVMLDSHANVNQSTPRGFNAIMFAAENGHTGCLKLLLQSDCAQISALELFGNSALTLACQADELECVQLLSSYGAKRDIEILSQLRKDSRCLAWLKESHQWITPLHHCLLPESLFSPCRARALLRDGADMHVRARFGSDAPSPLDLARNQPQNASAQLVLCAASWSPISHELFPSPDRVRAIALLCIGRQLAEKYAAPCESGALIDVWISCVIPRVMLRTATSTTDIVASITPGQRAFGWLLRYVGKLVVG